MIINEINREEASGVDAFGSQPEKPIEWEEDDQGISMCQFISMK